MTDEPFSSGLYDSLAGDSSIRLFGREMWDIMLRPVEENRNDAYGQGVSSPNSPVPPRVSQNNFLIDQLSSPDARLARISGFSYQNEYFDLAKPAIFLVHGPGTRVEFLWQAGTDGLTLKKSPTYTERSGMVGQTGSFAPDIFMWVYDRDDFTVRLDTEAGTFDRVLLAAELSTPISSDSMHGGRTDPAAPPRQRRRRWRSED